METDRCTQEAAMDTSTTPALPPGRAVDLPGRGRIFLRELPGREHHPTLLLLHGWTATADLNWHAVFPRLVGEYAVIAPDLRGHGRGIRSSEPFSLEAAADDAAALVEHLGCGPVIVVGYSMGGAVAQLLWRQHPELVDGLVMCATAGSFTGLIWERATYAGLPAIIGAARVAPDTMRSRIALGLMSGSESWPLYDWARSQIVRHDWLQILQAGQAIGRFDSHAWLGHVDVPTSVVVTVNDRTVAPERQMRLAASIPRARLHESAGGHDVVLAEPRRFLPPLFDALGSVSARGTHPGRRARSRTGRMALTHSP
jgi:pimeloyl-ACP methyl ester carboxylesterase